MAKKYIILERDDTIIHEPEYSLKPSIKLLDGAIRGLRQFQRLGYGLIIITNQPESAQKTVSEAMVKAVHNELVKQLRQEGIVFDAVYYCPHTSEEQSRSPKLELIKEASKVFNFKPENAIIISHKAEDIMLGQAIKTLTVLVRTSKGFEEETKCSPDMVADNLMAAARMIGLAGLLDEMNILEAKLCRPDHIQFMKEATVEELLRCF